MIQIDETQIPESLLVSNEDGTKTIDYSKIKTTTDVENVLNSKNHVKQELNELKQKYANIDVEKYNSLLANELEQNKDVIQNPVYKNLEGKYSELQNQFSTLQKEIERRDQELADSQLKDEIRKFKSVEVTATDDILYRLKSIGVSKTERGFLDKNGRTVDSILSEMQTQAPHLFKRTVGIKDSEREARLANAKTNSKGLKDILLNCPNVSIK